MPVYEYTCEACGRSFEWFARTMDAPHDVTCPECESRRVSRRLSVFAAGSPRGETGAVAAEGGGCMRCGDPNGPCGR